MPAKSTRPAKAPPAAAGVPPEIPDYRAPLESDWRQNPDRVKWWREVLRHQFGIELAAIIRASAPEKLLAGADSPKNLLALSAIIKQSEGSVVGMIAGFEKLRKLLLETLATPLSTPTRPRRPGEPSVEPHPVTI